MSTDPMTLPWIKASERLPDFNRRVIAWLEGSKEHSGFNWKRSGFAFMVRHNDPVFTVANQWATCFYNDACKQIDADQADVTYWFYLERPSSVWSDPRA